MTQSLSGCWSTSIDVERLWNRDKTLWTGADEDKWLGWLDLADRQLAQRQRFTHLDAVDLPIPGRKFTGRGVFDVLAERQRRALRVHLPADLRSGPAKLQSAIMEALR